MKSTNCLYISNSDLLGRFPNRKIVSAALGLSLCVCLCVCVCIYIILIVCVYIYIYIYNFDTFLSRSLKSSRNLLA